MPEVAPHAGAWIETTVMLKYWEEDLGVIYEAPGSSKILQDRIDAARAYLLRRQPGTPTDDDNAEKSEVSND